jgi:hypothetical protein
MVKDLAQGERNITCVQPGSSYLVEQWLELVVIEPVYERYLKSWFIVQFTGQAKAAESRPYND